MIRTLAYFPSQTARNSTEVLAALNQATDHHGIKLCADDLDADAAVIWSVLWHGRMRDNKKVYQHYRALGRPIIVIDVGALHRNHTWKIAINHISREGYYGHKEDLDLDRPKKLGISLGQTINPNPSILLAAQHLHSLQVQDVDLTTWLDNCVNDLMRVCDRPLILRPHPRCRMDLQRFQRKNVEIQQPKIILNTYDSFDMDLNYHAVVNYNSGPGIQAAISGTRPIVGYSSLASEVSIDVDDIESPYDIDREQWLIEICHTEYTLEEISQGLWIKRLHLS